MRRRFLPIALFCLGLAAPGAARARDMNGKFGLGYEQTLGGVSGIHLKYHVRDFVIQGVLGFDIFKPTDSDPRTAVRGALGVAYHFARFEVVNLGIGIRGDVGWRNGEAVTAAARSECRDQGGSDCDTRKEPSAWEFNLEIPLLAEVFFTDHFALSLQTGVLFQFVTKSRVALQAPSSGPVTDGREKGFGFGFGGGGLFASMGFTVYF